MRFLQTFTKFQLLIRFLGILGLCVLFFYLYKLLIPRINAFGCMDDCNNFLGGYFLLNGKNLFSQIFFNHAPFMAHISAFVQYITRPENLHEIILRHRQFGLLFDFVGETMLLLRFGILSLPFALVYELSKFYLGGDRFLAEGYIVYPLTYLLGLVAHKAFKRKIFRFDFAIAAASVWFVIFMREPYSIVALVLFVAFLWQKPFRKIQLFSIGLFILLSVITLFSYSIYEFFYNVVFVNQTTLTAENNDTHFFSIQLYRSFVYPFLVFFQGEWQFVRYIEMIISALLISVSIYFVKLGKWRFMVMLWVLLGLANIRYVAPGHEYYGAFHLLPWFAMTGFITSYLLWEARLRNKFISIIGFSVMGFLVIFILISKGSYTNDKIDQQTEFITNYGTVLQVGNVIEALSAPKDSIFVDGFNDMVYMVSQRYSLYPYSWYTSLMPLYSRYTDARISMFRTNPPDFYYGNCPNEKASYYLLPNFVKNQYTRLYDQNKPSCLWVKKSKLASITDVQWQKAGESLYFLHPSQ